MGIGLCTVKYSPKKKGSDPRGRQGAQARGALVFGSLHRILHNLLKRRKVVQIPFSAFRRDTADGLRPVAIMAFHDLDHLVCFQHAQMSAQIAIRQRAQLLQIVEIRPLGFATRDVSTLRRARS